MSCARGSDCCERFRPARTCNMGSRTRPLWPCPQLSISSLSLPPKAHIPHILDLLEHAHTLTDNEMNSHPMDSLTSCLRHRHPFTSMSDSKYRRSFYPCSRTSTEGICNLQQRDGAQQERGMRTSKMCSVEFSVSRLLHLLRLPQTFVSHPTSLRNHPSHPFSVSPLFIHLSIIRWHRSLQNSGVKGTRGGMRRDEKW